MEQVRISSPQAPQGGAQASRGKLASSDGLSAAAGSGEFLSLLSALGGEVLQDVSVSASDLTPSTTLFGDAALALPGQDPLLPLATPASLLPESPATDMAALLALQGGWGSVASPGVQVVAVGGTGTAPQVGAIAQSVWGGSALGLGSARNAGGGGELGLVAQTAAFDTAAEEPVAHTALASALGARRAGARALGAVGPGDLAAASVALKAGASDRQVLAIGGGSGAPTASVPPIGASALASSDRRESAATAVPAGQPQADMALVAPGPAALGAPEWLRGGQGLARGSEGIAPLAGAGSQGTSAASAPLPDSAEVGQPFDPSAALGPEDTVAEQVAYWVSQNIQNAELTVEHAGHPVEVSVALTGKEAHVTFRSDQDQTRELLDASVEQLRELLGREGLELSGVTVGHSGAQGGQSGEAGAQREGQRGARQVTVQVPGIAASGQRSAVLTDKAVDVFV